MKETIEKWDATLDEQVARSEDAIKVIKQYEEVIMAHKRKAWDCCSNNAAFWKI